jgi:hypothetical protein
MDWQQYCTHVETALKQVSGSLRGFLATIKSHKIAIDKFYKEHHS